ncbi:hypothetical protein TKK_0018500 [Trichogramma kaykai]
MTGPLRQEALRVFKQLHKTRLSVFQGDEYALNFMRNKINEEYRKNKNVTDEGAIQELLKFAKEVDKEVRTTVVQAVEKKPGVFEVKISPDTVLHDNVPFGQTVDKKQFRGWQKCCSEPTTKK